MSPAFAFSIDATAARADVAWDLAAFWLVINSLAVVVARAPLV